MDINKRLRESSRLGLTPVVKLLLESGADVHACNNHALILSERNGQLEVVKLLKSYMEKVG